VGNDLLSSPGLLVGFFLGVLVGWVTLWSFLNPQVGKIVARAFAVVAIGIGVTWIVTPITDILAEVKDPHYESPFGKGGIGPALGWGVGATVAGLMALVFSFLRGSAKREAPKEATKISSVLPAEKEVV
jgi:hypothetical protein